MLFWNHKSLNKLNNQEETIYLDELSRLSNSQQTFGTFVIPVSVWPQIYSMGYGNFQFMKTA